MEPSKDRSMHISHEAIELWPGLFGAENPFIHVFAHDFPATARCVFPKLSQLYFWMLNV